jgi:hypothetical protein
MVRKCIALARATVFKLPRMASFMQDKQMPAVCYRCEVKVSMFVNTPPQYLVPYMNTYAATLLKTSHGFDVLR